MRILFLSNVIPDPSGGGVPQRMANHLRALLSLGEVTLIVPHSDGKPLPELPEVRVLVRGPTLADQPGIVVASNAPSVDPYYAEANIVIAPLQAGSGTRIKLIEAAAKRRAIVTTTLGCEGLGFEAGVHAEIADDPADFAARIIALARDPARRALLAGAARAHAMREFSADAIAIELAAKIAGAVDHAITKGGS